MRACNIGILELLFLVTVICAGCEECKTSDDCPRGFICRNGSCEKNKLVVDTDDTDTDSYTDGDADTDMDSDSDTDTGVQGMPTWVKIAGGVFMMGNEDISGSTPVHEVTVPDFEITKAEVTVAMYKACFDDGSCPEPKYPLINVNEDHKSWGDPSRGSYPVNGVVREHAVAYCTWVDENGRLPSEAEWEYAARSQGQDVAVKNYPWGTEAPTCDHVVCEQGPVCSSVLGQTEQGLCDMAGGVWEWIDDYYHDDYTGAPTDGSARLNPSAGNPTSRVVRGGGFHDAVGSSVLRTASRLHWNETGLDGDDAGEVDLGFRCARSEPCAYGWHDTVSDLCWEDPPRGTVGTWQDASSYCDSLSVWGKDDWYLPSIGELRSLVRGCSQIEKDGSCGVTDSCTDTTGCPNADCAAGCSSGDGPGQGGCYWHEALEDGYCDKLWSSTSALDSPEEAWVVDFSQGTVSLGGIYGTSDVSVRCVR